jgi:DNA-binding IclR family transcriptional regulator
VIVTAEPIDADTLRIRHEFLVQQDLQLPAGSVAELLGVPLRHAVIMLESLAAEGFLRRTADGQYTRAIAVGAARRT